MSVITEIANWGFQAEYKNIWLEHIKWVHDEILNKSLIEKELLLKRGTQVSLTQLLKRLWFLILLHDMSHCQWVTLQIVQGGGGGWGSAFKTERICKWLCLTYQ